MATSYASFGLLFNSILLDELKISEESFCDKEIVLEDNVSLDEYGVGIYINPLGENENSYQVIRALIERYNYDFDIYSTFDGMAIQSLEEEKARVRSLHIK
ncbi:MAG: hypothetical protein NC483_00935 [Ruminococcus sp.]|nr:hypothetical protein [Ruminococcus sp.]